MVKLVRDTIGPVAAFRKVLFVRGLPKTRSGKIPRSSLANLVNGKPYKVRHNSEGNIFCVTSILKGTANVVFVPCAKLYSCSEESKARFAIQNLSNDGALAGLALIKYS